jgi:hypothetical protein
MAYYRLPIHPGDVLLQIYQRVVKVVLILFCSDSDDVSSLDSPSNCGSAAIIKSPVTMRADAIDFHEVCCLDSRIHASIGGFFYADFFRTCSNGSTKCAVTQLLMNFIV